MKKRLVIVISISFIVICITTIINNMTLSYTSEPQGDSLLVVSPSTVERLVVEYKGPSVAPQHYREYRAEFSSRSIEFCLRDYKDILVSDKTRIDIFHPNHRYFWR